MSVHIVAPDDSLVRMEEAGDGYYEATVQGIEPGARYFYRLDNQTERPDPASRFQPEGVHGPSEIVEPRFSWSDEAWHGRPLPEYIFYELHLGTFTPNGTFIGVIERLDDLVNLGVTAIELMPVAACPGARNWGYDGVYPFAVQQNYGGPAELKRLVDACHKRGLAMVLDVVYNHMGPEGNYLAEYGPYFTNKYTTGWGEAINFDGPESREVRRFFIANALRWITEFHIDALRLDAVHAIFDASAEHFLKELAIAVHQRAAHNGRPAYVIAESNFNIPRLTMMRDEGGDGLDAQWNDDFHYAVHSRLTGEHVGHYRDFGSPGQITKALTEGFVLTGQWSHYRARHHGESSHRTPAERLVISLQNHDETGNRPGGERIGHLVDFEARKLAAAMLFLSPYVPLIFMGEEYDEPAPFLFFTDFGDGGLDKNVRRGRRAHFKSYGWTGADSDPADPATFDRCRLNWKLRGEERHATMLRLYRRLIELRKLVAALRDLNKRQMEVTPLLHHEVLVMRRWATGSAANEPRRNTGAGHVPDHGAGREEVIAVFNLSRETKEVEFSVAAGKWRKLFESTHQEFDGPGSSLSEEISTDGTIGLALPAFCAVMYESR